MLGLALNEYAPSLLRETLLRAGTPALPTTDILIGIEFACSVS